MGAAQNVYRGVCIFSCCVQVIVAGCLIYAYTKVPKQSGISLGFSTTDMDSMIAANNLLWTDIYAPLILGILSLVMVIAEILLVIIPTKVEVLNAPVFRGIVYVGLGALALGVTGDLGIAAGSLSIIDGALVLIFGIWASV